VNGPQSGGYVVRRRNEEGAMRKSDFFPRLDHRFGVDGRVGLNFAVTILGLLFDFQTLRQGAAVRRRGDHLATN
jgi:hypothetical protein